ncbi:MAG: hypothetical protein JO347_03820, partial [Candidatus Eremiobacteraeota bacterium]|nr:hypothetical protein [Candidatus Eremiobacteraeota bacterium]
MVLGFNLQDEVGLGLHYLGVPWSQPGNPGDTWLLQQLPGRIAGMVEVLDAMPEAQRPVVVAAAQRPNFHVQILDAPFPNLTNQPDPNADSVRRRIEAVLRVPHPVIAADRYSPVDKPANPVADRAESGLFIEAALSDGRWLLFRSELHAPPFNDPVWTRFLQAKFAASLALSVLIGILL